MLRDVDDLKEKMEKSENQATMAEAKAWYESPEYTAAKVHRSFQSEIDYFLMTTIFA